MYGGQRMRRQGHLQFRDWASRNITRYYRVSINKTIPILIDGKISWRNFVCFSIRNTIKHNKGMTR